MTTIPSLTPILDAVRDVRAELSQVRHLPHLILSGDAEALEIGEELMTAIERLWTDISSLTGNDLELVDLHRLLGVNDVTDAVLVATGEVDSDDPEINERFKAVRLESHRRRAERWVDELLLTAGARPLTAIEQSLLDQCEQDLGLIAAGIEPE